MKSAILCGMPSSGKTTLARKLGELWGVPWYDLDELVEEEGTPIEELFEDSEKMFRFVESRVLFRFMQLNWTKEFVLALGGGTLENKSNLGLLITQSRPLCFLDIPVSVLYERLVGSEERADRPLLKNVAPEDLEQKLHEMRLSRLDNYLQSPIITGLQAFNNLDLFTKRVELFTKKR